MRTVFFMLFACIFKDVACNPLCDQIPHSLQVAIYAEDEDDCLSQRACWRGSQCYAEKCTLSCDIGPADRFPLPFLINEADCELFGGCWDDGGGYCFTCLLNDPCPSIDRTVCLLGASTAQACSAERCCFEKPTSECYVPQDCEMSGGFFGPCSKTCGIGVRVQYDGCRRFYTLEECCDGPCPNTGGGGGSGKLCRDYPPYSLSFG